MKTIYLDTEVTGLEKQDKLCQIAFLVEDEEGSFEIYEELCNPQIPITKGATECHGITDEMVADKDTFVESSIYRTLESFNDEENCIVAHNAGFDLDMLQRDGSVWRGKVLDTLKVARSLYNKDNSIKSFALQNLRNTFSLHTIEQEMIEKFNTTIKAHDALGDVLSLYALVKYLTEFFNISLEKLIEISNSKTVLTYIPFGKYRNKTFNEIAQSDPKYLKWILENDFDDSIKYTAKLALEKV